MPYTHCQGHALNLAVKGACFKGTVMQIEKSLLNDRLRISKIAMNAKILVFVICAEPIIYFLFYNLPDCTFKVDTPIVTSKMARKYWRLVKVHKETTGWRK